MDSSVVIRHTTNGALYTTVHTIDSNARMNVSVSMWIETMAKMNQAIFWKTTRYAVLGRCAWWSIKMFYFCTFRSSLLHVLIKNESRKSNFGFAFDQIAMCDKFSNSTQNGITFEIKWKQKSYKQWLRPAITCNLCSWLCIFLPFIYRYKSHFLSKYTFRRIACLRLGSLLLMLHTMSVQSAACSVHFIINIWLFVHFFHEFFVGQPKIHWIGRITIAHNVWQWAVNTEQAGK